MYRFGFYKTSGYILCIFSNLVVISCSKSSPMIVLSLMHGAKAVARGVTITCI